ncbi:TIGR02302 family protein [Ovoidimarina sediminis]|uniref:TIGR02302 family protein n=1 Tax=Ovoidimarina sediminis TaxID=3079856 RepID=UPI002908F831|nr:TIGR02302 family protein [Rhodophyticola sp. MJ-SS7]MDU8946064.1 TIGR02302 family protein [Rhodophyticola sp. MJ-SS7]
MTKNTPHLTEAACRLKWPLRLTQIGLFAERATRAFWPLVTVVLLALSALMLGLHETMALELVWAAAVLAVSGTVWALWHGAKRFRWPSSAEAMARLDASLPGRPISALTDQQMIGTGDAASEAVWKAHVARMAERAKAAKAVNPDLKISNRDPYALRYVALVAFATAVIFGSIWRVSTVTELAPGAGSGALAEGPSWEGWIEPPAYTGRPSLYLNDITRPSLAIPEGSEITLRLYGEIGALTVGETVSARTGELPPASEPSQAFKVVQSGRISIDGPGGQAWDIRVIEDDAPEIEIAAPLEKSMGGEFRQPFTARDDYGVVAGRAILTLDPDSADRRFGLAAIPERREPVILDLPMPITGDRSDFEETLIDEMAKHPWAGLPVTLVLEADDAAGQTGASAPEAIILPARRFFDPLAAAIIEQRRDLLWSRSNSARVAQILRAVSYRPDDVFRSETTYMKLRVAVRRLETAIRYAEVSETLRDETAEVLWSIALEIEEGDLSDALERLRRAQDRLQEAIRNGATDEEIAELMRELREAMQDYMRQLAEQQGQNPDQKLSDNQNMQEITGDQLQDMLDRLQELMEQGRMDEAQALLDQLRQMMENMQIAQGQPGEGQQSPGQQAMEGLAETLREQQGLSDEAFRDLQQQFGQGQQGQPGQPGQPGQGQPGEGDAPGQPGGSLADRQQALRDELLRQQQNLPGAGTEEGDAARDALDRAGRAMENAEEALRDEDFAGALDDQSEAIDALREGMRELGEAMAQQQGQPGQQGDAAGTANQLARRDPLGREAGPDGRLGTDEELLQGEDIYRRARDLLDEIRRRSAEQSRPEAELDYLRRLLDRF